MIKLETQEAAPQASSLITILSQGTAAAVVLSSSDAWKPQEDDFVRDDTKRKQIISFISDGRTVEIIGAVAEADCVEIGGAWKVVGQFKLVPDKQKAGVLRPVILRVVEVWTNREKCLYRAKDWPAEKPGALTMDPKTGKLERTAA